MDIKMIVTDLDSTLLRSDKTISCYTADVLCRCREQGIKLVFATARPRRTVVQFFGDFAVDALILHSGAVITVGDRVLSRYGIDAKVKDRILQEISRDFPDATVSVEIEDLNYANFDMKAVWPYDNGVISDFTDLPDKPAEKLLFGASSQEEIDRFSAYLPDDLYIQLCEGILGLVMHKTATKWAAVQEVAAHFGVPVAQAVAFGDDFLDIEMMRGCGIGVAVGNARDEVKAAADCVCAANDDDGVAKWLEANLLSPS